VPDNDLDIIRAAVARKAEEQRKTAEAEAAKQQQEVEVKRRKEATIQEFRLRLGTEVEQALAEARTALGSEYLLNRSQRTVTPSGVIIGNPAVVIDAAVYTVTSPSSQFVTCGFFIELLDDGQVRLASRGVGGGERKIPLTDLKKPLVLTAITQFIAAVLGAPIDHR
jgi:hypothetical protein